MAYKRKDAFYVRAKSAGYRSRAAYKLAELQQRHHLIRSASNVVDLGAWPGGWLQIASAAVGPTGIVVGVDLQRIDPLGLDNVRTLQGDVTRPDVQQQIRELCRGPADVVLSDLSPQLSGIRDRDEARAGILLDLALTLARQILRPGGTFVAKLFMNPSAQDRVADLKLQFAEVRTTRPDATRKSSAEFYVIARGWRGAPAEGTASHGET